MEKIKIIRTATVAMSLDILLKGQLAFLQQYYHILAVSGEDRHLENVAEREGVQVVDLAMERKISPVKDVVTLLKLIRLFKKEKPHIVHSITPKAGLLSMVAAKIAGVPVRIHTFTGLIFPTKKGRMQQLLIAMDKLLCAAATHIIPEGKGVQQDLLSYQITNKPLSILANGNVNGLDVDYYHPQAISQDKIAALKLALGIGAADYVFCFVGRLVKDKGIEELIAAFDALAKQYKHIHLVLVGPLEMDQDPISVAALTIIKAHPAILTVGFQQDIRPYVLLSDVFVFPSYREGFPNVVLQAGAMGRPCIVTDISGSNEIIQTGINGHIIPSKSIAALKAVMEEYIKQTYVLDALAIRSMVVAKYSNEIVWDALHQYYKKCLS